MYTLPSRKGEGIGGWILDRLEALAREDGLTRLVLETGHVHHAAYRVRVRQAPGQRVGRA